MDHLGVEVGDALDRDALALFDGQRVVSRFELNEGTQPVIAQMDTRF